MIFYSKYLLYFDKKYLKINSKNAFKSKNLFFKFLKIILKSKFYFLIYKL